jgi:hypothetical protein
MLGCGYMYISLVGVAGRRQCQCMQLTMADVSTNIDDKGRPRRCPSACTIARTSFPQPRTNTRTNTDINLSSASRILLCAALIDSTTNPDRNHRIDRRHQAAARARSGACHHTPAESLIIILSHLQQPYHLYRCSSSLFTYIISLLPVFTTHTLPSFLLPSPLHSTSLHFQNGGPSRRRPARKGRILPSRYRRPRCPSMPPQIQL